MWHIGNITAQFILPMWFIVDSRPSFVFCTVLRPGLLSQILVENRSNTSPVSWTDIDGCTRLVFPCLRECQSVDSASLWGYVSGGDKSEISLRVLITLHFCRNFPANRHLSKVTTICSCLGFEIQKLWISAFDRDTGKKTSIRSLFSGSEMCLQRHELLSLLDPQQEQRIHHR
jgi:hypothetical protein